MSRTDKTAPFKVKVHDRTYWLIEAHDHRNHVCDLPPRPKPGEEFSWISSWDQGRHRDGQCHWSTSDSFFYDNHCGCATCSNQAERKQIRRKERRMAKKENRDWESHW